MADESGGGGPRLTGAGKAVLFLVGLVVLGYVGWTYRDRLPALSSIGRSKPATTPASTTTPPASQSTSTAEPPKGLLAKIRQTGVMRVGMEPAAPPLPFLNARNQDNAFDFRFASLIAENLAPSVEVVEADYDDLPDKLAAGDIDVIMAGYVRTVHQGRGLVHRLPGFRPLHDRAGGDAGDVPLPPTWPVSASRSTTTRRPNDG